MIRPRIILIRENAETLTCSNCAGTLEGIDAFGTRRVPDYEPIRDVMSQMGTLYRALRAQFGNRIEIEVVDPRNALYLLPVLFADYRRYRPPFGSFVKTLFFGISPASVIVNGTVHFAGALPAPEQLVNVVRHVVKPSTSTETPTP